jgi:hypothetical protein
MTNIQAGSIIAVLMISVIFCGADALGQEVTAKRSTLEVIRRASLENFALEVELERPAHGFMPGQGRTTRLLRLTVGKDVTAMVWNATQLPPPKYFPPGGGYSGGDFDSDGNLIMPISFTGASLRDPMVNEEYSESIAFHVAPDGSVTQSGPSPFLVRHDPSSMKTESLGLMDRILWALGRPWDGFGGVISEEEEANGNRSLRTTTGGWSVMAAPGFERTCDLLIAPGDGFLIRHADFGRGRRSRPPVQSWCWSGPENQPGAVREWESLGSHRRTGG